MTNEEAINILRGQESAYWDTLSEAEHKAFDLAVDALELLKEQDKRGNTCETMCRYAPPLNKWPCVDCDMRYHDRAEPPKEEAHE